MNRRTLLLGAGAVVAGGAGLFSIFGQKAEPPQVRRRVPRLTFKEADVRDETGQRIHGLQNALDHARAGGVVSVRGIYERIGTPEELQGASRRTEIPILKLESDNSGGISAGAAEGYRMMTYRQQRLNEALNRDVSYVVTSSGSTWAHWAKYDVNPVSPAQILEQVIRNNGQVPQAFSTQQGAEDYIQERRRAGEQSYNCSRPRPGYSGASCG